MRYFLSFCELLQNSSVSESDIELLACATSSPDQMLPSHASMVHGLLKNTMFLWRTEIKHQAGTERSAD